MGRKVNVSEVIGKSKLNGFMYGVIAIGVIMILFDGYDMGVWAGTLTSLRTDTGIEDVTLGFITSAGQFGSMLGGIFFGMLSDRIGRKTSLLLATGIYSVFTGLIGIASSPEALTVFKLVSGFGLAGFTPVVMTYLSEYTPIKSRALVTTMAISCVSVGSVISTAVCMGVLQTWGWRPLYLIAFVPIILFPLIALKMPDSPAHYVKTGKTDKVRNVLEKADPSFTPEPDDEYVVSEAEKAEKPSVIEALKGIFANGMGKYTILFWIVFMLTMYTSFTMQTWLARLMVYGGYGLTNSLFFLLLFNLCSLPAAAIVGWIADKVGFKKTIICLAIFIAVVIGVIGFVRSERGHHSLCHCRCWHHGCLQCSLFMHYVELSCRDSWYWCGLGQCDWSFWRYGGPCCCGRTCNRRTAGNRHLPGDRSWLSPGWHPVLLLQRQAVKAGLKDRVSMYCKAR